MSYAGDLTPREAWDLLAATQEAILVDVRTNAEWSFVGVPDAHATGRPTALIEWNTGGGTRNLRFLDQLQEAGLAPGDERPILFLCRSGQRSIGAAQAATAAGFGPAYNILDGFEGALDEHGHRGSRGWRAEGLPWRQS